MINETVLDGHCTFDIGGESYTFSLPPFTNTVIKNWGYPGEDGDFDQQEWDPNLIAVWLIQTSKYEKAAKYFWWVNRIPVIGWRIVNRLFPSSPGPNAHHWIANNYINQLSLIGTEGVVFHSNIVNGFKGVEFGG